MTRWVWGLALSLLLNVLFLSLWVFERTHRKTCEASAGTDAPSGTSHANSAPSAPQPLAGSHTMNSTNTANTSLAQSHAATPTELRLYHCVGLSPSEASLWTEIHLLDPRVQFVLWDSARTSIYLIVRVAPEDDWSPGNRTALVHTACREVLSGETLSAPQILESTPPQTFTEFDWLTLKDTWQMPESYLLYEGYLTAPLVELWQTQKSTVSLVLQDPRLQLVEGLPTLINVNQVLNQQQQAALRSHAVGVLR